MAINKLRDVAQLGSAPALGAGGRRFESCHPDAYLELEKSGVSEVQDSQSESATGLTVSALSPKKVGVLPKSRTNVGHFLSVAQAAQRMGTTPKTITRWCESGQLPAIEKPYGRKVTYLISVVALDMVIAQAKEVKQAKKALKPHSEYVSRWIRAMKRGVLNGKPYSPETVTDYKHYVDLYLKQSHSVSVKGLQKVLGQVPVDKFAKREHFYKAVICFSK